MPIGKVESFDMGSQNWDTYIRRVKQFMELNDIEQRLHVATLVTLVGSECYDLMCDLCAPDLPEEKDFDILVKLVKDHLEPERSEIAERHIFRQRKQQNNESIRSYLQSLKHLAKTCNFGITLEINLRDQFVSGLYSEEMRSRLFAEKDIDYKRAVELASALEAADRHAMAAGGTGGSSQAASESEGMHRVGGARAEARCACRRCGKLGHAEGRCRYKHYTCDSCGEKGHLKSMCRNRKGNQKIEKNRGQYYLNHSDCDSSDNGFYNLNDLISSEGEGPYYVKIFVQNVPCKFEIDTGCKISAISKVFYEKHFMYIPIQSEILNFSSYTGDVIETIGYIMVDVSCGRESAKLKLYVIKNGGPPLLGRIWIKILKLSFLKCHLISETTSTVQALRNEFPEVFAGGLGTCKSRIKLHLKEKTPIFVKARALPLALRERVERELDRLQSEGVIYKVDRSDYGTPIVPVVKANGDIRICGDYKITINPRLKDYHYPLPHIKDLFATLGGGEYYTKLDLSNAFQQCLLDEESQPMTAITTHVGTFVYKRVPFGIKCIPENFQKIMEEILSGLPSTVIFADDICVTGKNRFEHLSNLRAVLRRLKENGLRINYDKCKFFQSSVTYLGYKIDKQGLHTDKKKVDAIVAAPAPTNFTQLRSFMGLVNFYSNFVVNMSDILKPLYNLLKKNIEWCWTDKCHQAFIRIKKVLSSSPVLAHYNPNSPLVLSVDSSQYGLGAVLTQKHIDGTERLVSCASRTLAPAELNYSQLDKEALAIMFGVTKHHQYLYGRHFVLRSDHKALSYILGKNKGIPLTAASRLQRFAVKLAAYDFEVEFISSTDNCQADALSRLPLDTNFKNNIKEYNYLNFVQESFPLSFKEIKKEVTKDPLLNKIYGYVMFGWPSVSKEQAEKPYFNRRESIHIDHGCLLWGYRIIIPTSLRETVLQELHEGHPGIVKMKQLSRNYVWWETVDADIERVCAQCQACRSQRAAPPSVPLHSWPWPEEPWARLNLDFLGPFNNKYYLIIVDAHSKWIEVEKLSGTSATAVIACLRRLFARFGLAKRVVTDNGPPFSSVEFRSYLSKNGIKHLAVAPYHPSSNGAAENAVKTIKRVLKKALIEKEDDNTALTKFLFMYRNSEHSTTGREPAVALFGRRLRGRLDLLRPNTSSIVREAQLASESYNAGTAGYREAAEGDSVLLQDFTQGKKKWTTGTIKNRSGPVTYRVTADDGRVHKRHIDQILISNNSRKSRYSLSKLNTDFETKSVNDSVGEVRESPCMTGEKELNSSYDTGPESPQPVTSRHSPAPNVLQPSRQRRKAALTCIQRIKDQNY